MSGLVGAWWKIWSLVPVHQVEVSSRVAQVLFGQIEGGATLMMPFEGQCLSGLVVAFGLCLVLCSLFRELCFGRVILALQAAGCVHLGKSESC